MNVLPTVLGIVPLVPIVIICYILGATLKGIGKEELDKFIPVICGVFGGLIGILVFYTIPGYLSSTNWLDAFATGAASGLVAVGVNQIYKQLSKEIGIEYVSPDEATLDDPNDDNENDPDVETETDPDESGSEAD